MTVGNRQGVAAFIWRNFVDSLSRKRFQKTFVGIDEEGNKYYELIRSRRVVNRGFVPAKTSSEVLPPEWLTWLRGIRKLPPSSEEILLNRRASEEMAEKVEKLKQQGNSEFLDSDLEKMPYIESTPVSNDFDSQPRGFPRYMEYDKEQPKMT
uniref:NADH dehydrogenase [ubiquinone] 1 alpha subcomplex subunit 12 n=1 Tax=Setaria digitata TaxID=48799 RepID=A0A915PW12_9BILA